MKKGTSFPIGFFLLLVFCISFQEFSKAHGQTDSNSGIQPLLELEGSSIHSLIPSEIQPLIFPQEITQFLQKLEGTPPDWAQLRHTDMTEQSERLFQFNRQRDTARIPKNTLLQQPVAFIWSGLLRHSVPESQGFSIALGPELTPTSWGIIRFKPIDLPDNLVAVPSVGLREQLLTRQKQGELIEFTVICIGTLISDESIMYGFSHDGHQEGMILPVVSVQSLIYILKPS